MRTTVWKKAIINTLASGGQNLGLSAATGGLPALMYISADDISTGTASFTIDVAVTEILPPIPVSYISSITKIASAAEVKQILMFGIATETIVASQRYSIKLGNIFEHYEGETRKVPFTYSYTAPAVLSGVAATDLTNVYTVLAAKINAHSENHVTAYLMYAVAYTLGTSTGDAATNFTIGTLVTQQTSGATAYVAGCSITSGTFFGDNAAGIVYLYNITGTWSSASKTITAASTTEIATTNAALTCQGLVIVDTAGYYPYNPGTRRGPSWLGCDGFVSAAPVVPNTATATKYGLEGVIARGIGSRMAQDIPYFNADKTDYSQGDPSFILNASPDITKTYTRVDITMKTGQVENPLEGNTMNAQFIYTVWIQEDSGLTNHDAFLAGLATITGITPS